MGTSFRFPDLLTLLFIFHFIIAQFNVTRSQNTIPNTPTGRLDINYLEELPNTKGSVRRETPPATDDHDTAHGSRRSSSLGFILTGVTHQAPALTSHGSPIVPDRGPSSPTDLQTRYAPFYYGWTFNRSALNFNRHER